MEFVFEVDEELLFSVEEAEWACYEPDIDLRLHNFFPLLRWGLWTLFLVAEGSLGEGLKLGLVYFYCHSESAPVRQQGAEQWTTVEVLRPR